MRTKYQFYNSDYWLIWEVNMKIAVCEDEEVFSEQIVEYINEWAKEKSIFIETFTYITAEKFLDEWGDSEDYDIIFIDIKMGKMNGMELAKFIRKTNNEIPLVFATSMKEYILKGYTVSAMQYLLKPVKKEDCFNCLNRVLQTNKIKKYYLFTDTDKTVRIPITEIIYIKMFSHTATIVTLKKEYEVRKTISQLLEELDDNLFIKCHKSFIINIRHIESVSKSYATMSNDEEIPLSKDVVTQINDMFIKYNKNKI